LISRGDRLLCSVMRNGTSPRERNELTIEACTTAVAWCQPSRCRVTVSSPFLILRPSRSGSSSSGDTTLTPST